MGLEVREITKKFGEKTAVDHLSFEMEGPGGVWSFRNKWSRKDYHNS